MSTSTSSYVEPEAKSDENGKQQQRLDHTDTKGAAAVTVPPYSSTYSVPRSAPRLSYYITGFGPFGGIEKNPTTVIIESLRELQQQQQDQQREQATNHQEVDKEEKDVERKSSHCQLANVRYFNVVRVSASSAKEEVDHILSEINKKRHSSRELKPSNLDHDEYVHRREHAIILHFGVNHIKGKQKMPTIQIEQNAYNQANFRIPDEDGYRPNKEFIVSNDDQVTEDVKMKLTTDLNVKRIKDDLMKKIQMKLKEFNNNGNGEQLLDDHHHRHPFEYDVSLSGDAGRFVCNYIYYQSLNGISKFHEQVKLELESKLELDAESGNGGEDGDHNSRHVHAHEDEDKYEDGSEVQVHALFVHVPSFNTIPKVVQVEFSLALLDSIADAVIARDTKKKKMNKKKKTLKEQKQTK